MIVDNIRKKHHGLSRNAQAVLDQTLRLKTDGHLVIRPKARILIPPNTATSQYIAMGGSLAMANIPYTRGMPFEYERRVTVTVGTQGFGFLMIAHDLTGYCGPDIAPLTTYSSSDTVDLWYSDSTYAGGTLPITSFNPSTGNTGVKVGSSCGTRGIESPSASFTGAHGVVVGGQMIELDANKSSVSSRKGTITVGHYRFNAPGTISASTLEDDPRFSTFDAADLTEESHFSTYRPVGSCGTSYFRMGGTVVFSSAAAMVNRRQGGYTVLVIDSAPDDEFVFDIKTIGAYMGQNVPIQTSFCPSEAAYSTIVCAQAEAMPEATTEDADKSQIMKRAYEHARESSVDRTPGYMHESLLEVGGKAIEKLLPVFWKAIV